jgi:hypothetical protein
MAHPKPLAFTDDAEVLSLHAESTFGMAVSAKFVTGTGYTTGYSS